MPAKNTPAPQAMNLVALLLALLLAPQQQEPRPTTAGRCDSGLWELSSESHGPNGVVATTHASSTVRCLFDGRLEMAEYRDLAPDGRVQFRGVSFHSWSLDRSERTTLWAMLDDPGYTVIVERMEDGVLQAEGAGQDARGSFLETSTTTFDAEGGYRFVMNRSYDDGATWQSPFNVIVAVRSGDAPAGPAELASAAKKVKAAAGATSVGVPILDGLAEVEARTERVQDRQVRTIRFASRQARPDRWRTLVWEVGALEVLEEALPIPKD